METVKLINSIVAVIFTICYLYQIIYVLVPFLRREPAHRKTTLHRFAVLISARNEEAVIAQLIDSIRGQDYPAELVDIYVVADNCTDDTARRARAAGATVLERFNRVEIGKGYALNWLLKQMKADGLWEKYDAYLVFDADNLLDEHYISEMNKTFSDGYEIATSYRNSKNFGDNWITAGYSLWFLREAKYLNQARMLLGSSCAVSGTGFLFSSRILKKYDGWNFFLLTEDIQFTIHNIVNGERVGYCSQAILFDEQPTSFRQSWRQRMRWAKGNIQVFWRYRKELLRGAMTGKSFSCFDMTMNIMPAIVLTIFSVTLNAGAAVYALHKGTELAALTESLLRTSASGYLMMFLMGALTTVTEWKQIHSRTWKKIIYMFTFPLFMATYIPISVAALFKKVEWLPIVHREAKTLNEVRGVVKFRA